jgi:hypothetical protein
MNTTVYPTNYDFSDDYFSCPSSFPVDEPWEFEMLSSNDTLPEGLDVFEEKYEPFSSSQSETLPSDEEVVSTPPPSSPNPFPDASMETELSVFLQMRNSRLLAQYQQQLQQYQLFLQQKLLLTMQTPAFPQAVAPPVQWAAPKSPVQDNCYSYEANTGFSKSAVKTETNSSGSDSFVKLTNLDATHFGTASSSFPKLRTIPVDISGNLSDAQYNKIFKKYHLQLQLDSHPTMTLQDLEDIKIHGKMYFLKNVKTIVPKIGPWKFNAHISHRRTDERQYNIPGMAVTCKVKEWLTDDGLWRLYHFKKGKTVKPKKAE